VNINGPAEVRLVIIDHAEQSRHRSSARLLSATPAGHSCIRRVTLGSLALHPRGVHGVAAHLVLPRGE
jgi:hypothetical protein